MRQPIAPWLLSDPAFSTDPYAHPYAVTSHERWLSSPPAGHPSLKNKTRRRPPSDSEPFHIPPPNSPVLALSLEPHSQSTSTAAEPIYKSPAQPTAPPPATPSRRITLMTILKRRSSHVPSSPSVNSKPWRPLTSSKTLSHKSHVIETQVFPSRPVTLGTSMPPTVPIPSTAQPTPIRLPTDVPANRLENLDRIDELDETNPWGIGFHHGGPYEAAVQAIRGKQKTLFPGHGSYNRGVPSSNDNNYTPPQATGFSLNLSPGQVLPRNYQPHYTPPSQPAQNSNPPPPMPVMMIPPAKTTYPQSQPSRVVPPIQSSATLPVSSRRQSYQPFSNPPRDLHPRPQSFNPTPTTSQVHLHTPSPLSSSVTLPQPQPHRIPVSASVNNPQPVPNSLPHHVSPNRVTEDPLSPVNLVSIGMGMVMLDDGSDEDEASTSSAPSQPSTNSDSGKHLQPKGIPIALRKTSPERSQPADPRIAKEGTSSSVSLTTQSQKTTLEEMLHLPPESPPPYSSPTKHLRSNEFGYLQAGVPSQPSFTSSVQRSVAPIHSNSQTSLPPTQAPSRAPSTMNQPAFPRSRHYTERAPFDDNLSVHPSLSSKSSSSRSTGPPSSRRVPNRLVMPAPLAQSSVASSQYQNRPPLAQLPPQRAIRQSLPPAPLQLSSEPIPSAQMFVKGQAQEIHFAPAKAGKLKKRVSLLGPASQLSDPPVVTTVSFAPPIIGFNHSVTREDSLGPVMTEKLAHKRILSKRRSNW